MVLLQDTSEGLKLREGRIMTDTNTKAVLIKDHKIVKEIYNIKSVVANTKYGYFEVTQRFYKHDITTIRRFTEVDRIELYHVDENYARYEKTPYKVVERN